jgi:predicted PurR-regulated permease PerM
VVGVMSSIGMFVIDLPFWLIVGMVAGLFNMIPLIGPWVGAVPGIIIALTTGGGVSKAVWVAIVMAIVQQIDNHFISPIVMQRAVKLHPAVVMLTLLAGGTLLGFFGLLLAVPAVAVLKIVFGHVWHRFVLDEPLDEVESRWELEDAEAPPGGVVERVGDQESALPPEPEEGR